METYRIGNLIIAGAFINDYDISEDGNEVNIRVIAIGSNSENTKIESGADRVRIKTNVEFAPEFNEEILMIFRKEVDKVTVKCSDGFMFINIKYVAEEKVKIKVVEVK